VAQNLLMLLIARVLIGLGSSCPYPAAMMLIQRRAKAAGMEKPPGGVLGGLPIAGIATASLGLPIGGVLVEAAGWRWVFLVNVPVALIALAAALIWIPRDPPQQTPKNARDVLSRIDLTGIIGFALAMTALLAFLFSIPEPNWTMLAAAVVLFVALTLWELRAKYPFVDVRLLVRNAALTRTYLRYALVALCVYVVLYAITQWLEAGRHLSALGAGLLLLPMSVISGVVAVPISRRNLIRGPVIVAALASLVGSAGVLFLTSDINIVWIVLITLVFGVALGTAASGNQIALYTQAPREQLGVASGLFRTFGYVGSIASSAITGIVFHSSVSDSGVHLIGLIMIGVSIVALALSIFDRRLRNPGLPTRQA
jgi:predicted MFS family arabinose efflux permease